MKPIDSRPRTLWVTSAVSALWLASFITTGQLGPRTAHAQAPQSEFSRPLGISVFPCTIAEVAAFGIEHRMHIRCTASDGGINFFAHAADPANVATANQLLAIANVAYALGNDVLVVYDTRSANNPVGCLDANCRLLTGIAMASP